jgi:tetratricopeptide (TPR) repeat protein
MTSDEGLKLLRLRDITTLQANKDEAMRIVDRLGGLPLAIDQAAAYIEYRRMAVEDFLPAYERERQKILDFTPDFGWEYTSMLVHGQAEEDRALSAFTTWEMSFQQLISNDPQKQESAAHFLTLHAFLDHLNVAEDLFRTFFKAGISPPEWLTIFATSTEDSDSDSSFEDDFSSNEDSLRAHPSGRQSRRPFSSNDTIQRSSKSRRQDTRTKIWISELFWELRAKCLQLSLLRVQSDNDQPDRNHQKFSLHPLIRDWLQLREKKSKRRSYCQEAITIVLVSIQSFGSQNTTADQKKELLAHMDACILNDKRFSKSGRTLGYDHCDAASIFANMYRDQGRWKEAEELFVQVMETRKRVLGEEHPDTLTSMANLASTFWNQGRWKEAEELEVQAMETRKRVLGEKHPDTLTSMNNLAFAWKWQGRDAEALKLMDECVQLRTRILGVDHPHTLSSSATLNGWQTKRLEIGD